MTTVAIPAEIVGDAETLQARRDDLDSELHAVAICLGRYAGSFTESGHRSNLIDVVARRDVLSAEIDRRWTARMLAR
jgi:hypothetical protein